MKTIVARCVSLIAIVAALSSVAGCSPCDQRLKAEHTVDQYLAQRELMAAKLRECANNPGELRDTPDCINVTAARYQGGMGSLPGSGAMKRSTGSMNSSGPPTESK